MREGVLAGYPMIDVKVAVYDGSYHPVDSNEMAFKTAARIGFQKAVAQAEPVLLEPWRTSRSRCRTATPAPSWATSPPRAAASRAWRPRRRGRAATIDATVPYAG